MNLAIMPDDMKANSGWHDIRLKPSGKWEARWADEEGVIHGKTWLTKPQAQKYAWDMANGILNASLGIGTLRKPIHEALKDFFARNTKANTREVNEYILGHFVEVCPEVTHTGQLTDTLINQYASRLVAEGKNPGGQNHHLKVVRAFTNFCLRKRWIAADPFLEFKMPKSEFKGWRLTPEQFESVCRIRERVPGSHGEVDFWLDKAFRFGRLTLLRISQVWKLAPKDFREPNELWVEGIKGQPGVWIRLRPGAAKILQDLLPSREREQRFFDYWKSVKSMQWSIYEKVRKSDIQPFVYTVNGERREQYPRYHDICKVSGVSDLMDQGMSPADLEHVSNTSQRTLITHYMKTDRVRAFDKLLELDRAQTESRPKSGGNGTQKMVHPGMDSTGGKTENDAVNK